MSTDATSLDPKVQELAEALQGTIEVMNDARCRKDGDDWEVDGYPGLHVSVETDGWEYFGHRAWHMTLDGQWDLLGGGYEPEVDAATEILATFPDLPTDTNH